MWIEMMEEKDIYPFLNQHESVYPDRYGNDLNSLMFIGDYRSVERYKQELLIKTLSTFDNRITNEKLTKIRNINLTYESNITPTFGYPVTTEYDFEGVVLVMEEDNDQKRNSDWRKNLEWMREADKDKEGIRFTTDEEIKRFIFDCQTSYGRTTKEHLETFEKKGYEGDVNERNWYRYAKYLIRRGIEYDT